MTSSDTGRLKACSGSVAQYTGWPAYNDAVTSSDWGAGSSAVRL